MPYTSVGTKTRTIDGRDKVTGAAQFTVDITLPRMLYGKIKRSPFPHAKILSIDTTQAEELKGVKAVMTYEDVPAIRLGTCSLDEYFIARDLVRFVGEPVAAAAAETPELAQEAVDLIRVEYEELPAVFDAEEAMDFGQEVTVHEDMEDYEVVIPVAKMDPRPPNTFQRYRIRNGDMEAGFEDADYIVENRFRTGYVHTASLEPHASVAAVDQAGHVTLWTSSQSPYIVREEICKALDLPPSTVRVIVPHVGGAFGGKVTIKPEGFTVVLARKAKRPVKVVFSRDEEFIGTGCRSPIIFYIKDGVTKDGKIVARRVKSIFQGGAYSGEGFLKPVFGTFLYAGSYRMTNLDVDSYGVYTNLVIGGALRGFGCAESAWAIESQMDILAEKLGLDPVQFRLDNLMQEDEESAVGMRMHGYGARECLEKAAEAIEWGATTTSEDPKKPWVRAKGIALGNKYSFAPTASSAIVKVHEDSTVELRTSAVDLGQGTHTILAQVVAEEFKTPIEKVKLVTPDTDVTPFDHLAGSSRQTYNSGNAVRMACDNAKEQIFARAADKLEANPVDLQIEDGKIFVSGSPDRSMGVEELFDVVLLAGVYQPDGEILGKATFVQGSSPMDAETGHGERTMAYLGHGAQAAEVDVNLDTGAIKVVKFVSAIDVGKAINPLLVDCQNHGGACMGIGIALHEEMVFDKGRMVNNNFLDYKIPSIAEMPIAEYMKSIIVEKAHMDGPYGAKGAGEIVIVPTAPALGNAIYNACGVRIHELPITPEKIVMGLKQQGRI